MNPLFISQLVGVWTLSKVQSRISKVTRVNTGRDIARRDSFVEKNCRRVQMSASCWIALRDKKSRALPLVERFICHCCAR